MVNRKKGQQHVLAHLILPFDHVQVTRVSQRSAARCASPSSCSQILYELPNAGCPKTDPGEVVELVAAVANANGPGLAKAEKPPLFISMRHP